MKKFTLSITQNYVIKYEFKDGMHVYTSDDVPGLLVAARDFPSAAVDLMEATEWLINKNHSSSGHASIH
ncbi:MAG: hypothetical protein INF44_02520 [Thalassospira sp.]|jgi:hypothetical protein|nr:hypothetical protein [Thalassospira sp.]